MKVIHICQRDDPATGGAVRVAVELVKRLPKYNIDSRLLFLYGSRSQFGMQIGDHCDYLGIRNSQDIFYFHRLNKYLSSQKPDIIHHHDGLLWPQLLTLFHPNYKKIIHSHSLPLNKPKSLKAFLLRKCFTFSANAVIYPTEAIKDDQYKNGGFRENILYVIHNGVDINHFTPSSPDQKNRSREILGLPKHAPVIGFVGRLHNIMKGTDDFLRVIAALPSEFLGLIVGTGPDLENLKKQAKKLNIENRVHFEGLLSDTAIAYRAMDIFCFTSRFEPFGLVILEAMASNVPVVGFQCRGGANEILTNTTGEVIENRDLNRMAEAIKSAYNQVSICKKRVSTARNLVETQYNWDISTELLAKLYTFIMSKKD